MRWLRSRSAKRCLKDIVSCSIEIAVLENIFLTSVSLLILFDVS